jgi:hypothetical protein
MTNRNFDFTGRIGWGEYGGGMAWNHPEMDDPAGVAFWVGFGIFPAGFRVQGYGSQKCRYIGEQYHAGIRKSSLYSYSGNGWQSLSAMEKRSG